MSLLFGTIFLTILLGTLIWPKAYEASSSILIKNQDYKNYLFPEREAGGNWTVFTNPREIINSEIEVIRSRPVLESVVRHLELYVHRPEKDPWIVGLLRTVKQSIGTFFNDRGRLSRVSDEHRIQHEVETLAKRLDIQPRVESQIIVIRYRHHDPELVATVVNAVTEEYVRYRHVINIPQNGSTFYEDQIRRVEDELASINGKLTKLRGTEGVIDFPEQSRVLVKELETFTLALANVRKEVVSKTKKVREIQKHVKMHPGTLIPLVEMEQNPVIQDLENNLLSQRFDLESLRMRYTDEARPVVMASEKVATLEAQLREQVQLFLDREVTELTKLQAEEQALKQSARGLESDIHRLGSLEPAIANFEKEREDKVAALTLLRNKYQEGLVAQSTDAQLGHSRILSPGYAPRDPIRPNVPVNLGLGLLLALVISVTTALFVEHWDDSVKEPDDVRKISNLSVVASLPHSPILLLPDRPPQ